MAATFESTISEQTFNTNYSFNLEVIYSISWILCNTPTCSQYLSHLPWYILKYNVLIKLGVKETPYVVDNIYKVLSELIV